MSNTLVYLLALVNNATEVKIIIDYLKYPVCSFYFSKFEKITIMTTLKTWYDPGHFVL